MNDMDPKIIQRFMSKIKKSKNCWIWTGGISDGYGFFKFENTSIRAHRFSYELFKEMIPFRMQIDHLCKNKKCVNPEHLEIVIHQENMMRSNSVSGVNSQKTHCPKGHKYSGVNKRGQRIYKTCIKVQKNNFRKRNKLGRFKQSN